MFGPLRSLTALAADVVEAALFWFDFKPADRLWEAAARPKSQTLLEEIAGHLGAIRALLEDTRNLIQQPRTGYNISPSAAVRPTSPGPAAEDAPRGNVHARAGQPCPYPF